MSKKKKLVMKATALTALGFTAIAGVSQVHAEETSTGTLSEAIKDGRAVREPQLVEGTNSQGTLQNALATGQAVKEIPSSAEIKPQVDEAKANVDKAQADVNNAQASLDAQEQVVKNAEGEVAFAEQTVSEAEQGVNKAQEIANQATPDKIAEAEDGVAAAETKVATAQDGVAKAEEVKTASDSAVTAQEGVVTTATTGVSTAQASVDKAQADVDTATKALDPTIEQTAKTNVDTLTSTVKSDEDKVASAQTTYDNAQSTLTAKQTEVDTKTAELQKTLDGSGDDYITKTSLVELKQKPVDLAGMAKAQASKIKSTGFANEDVDFNGTRTVDVVVSKDFFNQPVTRDWKKVTEYAIKYINELRALNGLTPVTFDQKVYDYSMSRSTSMAQNDDFSHKGFKVADLRALGFAAGTENISWTSSSDHVSDEEYAYYEVLGYFSDYSNAHRYAENSDRNYGHRKALLINAPDGYVAVTGATGADRDEYSQLTFASSTNSDDYYANTDTFTVTNDDADKTKTEFWQNGKRVKFLPNITFRYVYEETETTPNTARQVAQKELDTYKASSATELKTLTAEVDSSRKALADAEATLKYDQARLVKAQELLNSVSASKSEKEQALKDAQSKLVTATKALEDAKATQTAEQSKLDLLKAEQTKAIVGVSQAKEVLKQAETDLASAKALVSDLESAGTNLETAKTALETAKATQTAKATVLATEQAKLPALKTALEEAKSVLASATSVYTPLKAEYDRRVELEKLSKTHDITILADGTVVATPKVAPQEDEKPVLDLSAFKDNSNGVSNGSTNGIRGTSTDKPGITKVGNSIVYSRVEKYKSLPNTGSQTSLLTLLGISMLTGLGLGYEGRRKKMR